MSFYSLKSILFCYLRKHHSEKNGYLDSINRIPLKRFLSLSNLKPMLFLSIIFITASLFTVYKKKNIIQIKVFYSMIFLISYRQEILNLITISLLKKFYLFFNYNRKFRNLSYNINYNYLCLTYIRLGIQIWILLPFHTFVTCNMLHISGFNKIITTYEELIKLNA